VGDDSIDTVILHIDIGYLVTLCASALLQQHRHYPFMPPHPPHLPLLLTRLM
jgi:hypothetical protein